MGLIRFLKVVLAPQSRMFSIQSIPIQLPPMERRFNRTNLLRMDKKNIILGILFLSGGFLLMTWNGMERSKAVQQQLQEEVQQNQQALQESSWESESPPTPATPTELVSSPAVATPVPTMPADIPEEEKILLSGKSLTIELTTHGGAISRITLNDYTEDNPHRTDSPAPMVLNKVSDFPALGLNRALNGQIAPMVAFYELVEKTGTRVRFEAKLPDGLIIERSYSLGESHDGNSYVVDHQTAFRNPTANALSLPSAYLNLGTAAPTKADYMGFNLNASYLMNGDYDNIPASKFAGGGFIIKKEPKEKIEERGIIQWGAVKNQFFVTIYTPDEPAASILARGIRFPMDPTSGKVPMGVTAALEFPIPVIGPGQVHTIAGSFYAGPKNLDKLEELGLKQDEVMQLGWFLGMFLGIISFVAKMLLTLLGGIEGIFGNWGIAIILTTFVIRLLLWPLTAKAARASKRMQKLQKPLQQIREKYQDNPQKLNQEMMKLWKKHKINPLSGCWPVLLQFPIFIAFFNLLRNSSELRFAEFLWMTDLSMPDASIPLPGGPYPLVGTAINVLPFLWLVSMYFQMKMMPTPSIDNAQAKVIKWMPFIFFPFTYYFSSGLVLYWTTTNGFSIFQQWITNRNRDEEDVAIEEEIAEMEDEKKGKLRPGPLLKKKKKPRKKDSGGA
jgi:YidC/Oxa1 family membrane protein insertase